jgi:cobalt/nickel transport protein
VTGSSAAHFQLIYTPELNIQRAGDVPLKLIFWHPFDLREPLDMPEPQEFYVVSRGEQTDLMESLSPTTFEWSGKTAVAYEATLPVMRAGDYVVTLIQTPFFDETSNGYIQQFVKVVLNNGRLPTEWSIPLGLPTEIVPLVRPYSVGAGSTFTGQVLTDGEPYAGALIDVVYVAAEPLIDAPGTGPAMAAPPPAGGFTLVSDDNGYFTFGIPRAGFWGFAALGTGPALFYQDRFISQDAVLWIKAYDLGGPPN